MRLANRAQNQSIDSRAQKEFGLSSEILMEAAGCQAANEIARRLRREWLGLHPSSVIDVYCGVGGNGADGLVTARHLLSRGFRNVRVRTVGNESAQTPLFKAQLNRARLAGLSLQATHLAQDFDLNKKTLIIDAIFGIGVSREIEGEFKNAIEGIGQLSTPAPGEIGQAVVISLDIPSGLNASTGQEHGTSVRADLTLCFGIAKTGLFLARGPEQSGAIRVLPIGFPRKVVKEEAASDRLFTAAGAQSYLRQFLNRSAQSNKTSFGHAVLFAGHPGMWGAGVLAAEAAYRIGAGYVSLVSFENPAPIVASHPQLLAGTVDDPSFWENKKWRSAGIGPGLGLGEQTAHLINKLKRRSTEGDLGAVVVDADAITVAAREKLFPFPASWILTPHVGELARIISEPAEAINENRQGALQKACALTGCHVLLKGAGTLISDGQKLVINSSGNASLAKAGSGDVLTGFIAGLLAQGLGTLGAASFAAFIHGLLADEWVESGRDQISLQATDLTSHLPQLLARLRAAPLRRTVEVRRQ
jgi:hydroxyethylthiazole kinase-like uncharacterized protein yjeF